MATNFGELKSKVLRILRDTVNDTGDAIQGNVYFAEILQDSVHAALKRVSNRLWKNSVMSIETEGTVFALPSDLLDIQSVFDNKTGMFLPKIDFAPGQVLSPSNSANAWMDFPGNSLTFLNTIGTEGAKVYYMAHWTLPTKDNDVLECPEVCITALVLYAASYCLAAAAVESGDVAQFRTKVDSGRPTDIPAKDLSDWFLRRFENELNTLPLRQRN